MAIEIACPSCGRLLTLGEKYAGLTVKCPACSGAVKVPGAPPQAAPPLADVVPASAAGPVDIETLRFKKEKTAAGCLIAASIPAWIVLLAYLVLTLGTLLIIVGVIALSILLGKLIMRARIRTNSVRVSPTQFPQIYAAAAGACAKLNMPIPEIYVMQDSVWNAWATRLAGTDMVVLLSGSVDSILLKGDMRQVTWLVAHELGHHAAGHFGWKSFFLRFGSYLIWINLWYSRCREYTADRIALYVTGSTESSLQALCNMSVGAQLARQVNVNEAIAQWNSHRNELAVKYSIIYSTHPPNLARMEQMITASTELGVPM